MLWVFSMVILLVCFVRTLMNTAGVSWKSSIAISLTRNTWWGESNGSTVRSSEGMSASYSLTSIGAVLFSSLLATTPSSESVFQAPYLAMWRMNLVDSTIPQSEHSVWQDARHSLCIQQHKITGSFRGPASNACVFPWKHQQLLILHIERNSITDNRTNDSNTTLCFSSGKCRTPDPKTTVFLTKTSEFLH